jgi:very-short-patch-repair endonuclease
MEHRKIHSLPILKQKRTALRNNLTPAEAKLWTSLKSSQLNDRKFVRQHSIKKYIVDFYCPSEKLIVELDGQMHFNTEAFENDKRRTERLNELGFTVVRFENKLVFHDLPGVLNEIAFHFKAENRPTPEG